ncbi:hypothetical protein GCM10011360_02620 [Primorskyibacter flagellatus]|uniref:Prohead serine protease domain-containing protein n=1 Tax=Primorskyibacter flagellatus TaxID=1387277 RepID=A0A916ZXQ7_9RHOB|nr:HK97 family phage prohead protease [Primorskyibacter flagellatus]GGE17291.1 hypothetical protein GCM10011360_02620 [Primorskyibacter flagellatus]
MHVEGWASTGDRDHVGHTVLPSAYAKSIARFGLTGPKGIKFLFHHDPRQPLGHIKKLEVRNAGLWIEADINEDISYGRDIAVATKAQGGLNFSVGFFPVEWYFDKDERPVFTEVELDEVSVVVFPANSEATMSATEKTSDPTTAAIAALTRVSLTLNALKGQSR